jgi:release factor glutamine methyltransferase
MTDHVISGMEFWLWYRQAQIDTRQADVSISELDWLLQGLLGFDALTLRLQSFKDLSSLNLSVSLSELTELWARRLHDRVPVQYLLGRVEWRNFSLVVSAGVLIPRPETELMIDIALEASRLQTNLSSCDWVDLGTGSGAIALGLAEVFPQGLIHAVDVSAEGLAIACLNRDNLGFTDRIKFYQGRWWEPLAHLKGKVRGMLSNPPYIPSEVISTLQPEVAHHEPLLALDGGEDGLDCIRYLVETAPDYLQSGGLWLIEMMAGQGEDVAKLLYNQGSYGQIKILSDLAGFDRYAIAYRI